MGTGDIDIVLNELDALVNIDFQTKAVNQKLKKLTIIRLGTSGAVQPDIPIGSLVLSQRAVGFDNVLYFYRTDGFLDLPFGVALREYLQMPPELNVPYVATADAALHNMFCKHEEYISGITGTNSGFYGPQGRLLRAPICGSNWIDRIEHFSFEGQRITNFDMETAAIVGLAGLMGHHAMSINAIIANRVAGTFAEDTDVIIDNMIRKSIAVVVQNYSTSTH
jgi:uridine phosphorylase